VSRDNFNFESSELDVDTPEGRSLVVKVATALWREFLNSTSLQPGELLEGDLNNMGQSKCAVAFYDWCAAVTRGMSGAVILNRSLGRMFQNTEGVAASWIWNIKDSRMQDRALVTVNRVLVQLRKAESVHRVRKTITYLILHETGHLVLHWHLLHLPGRMRQSLVNGHVLYAHGNEEMQAWLFALAVVAESVGQLASEADGKKAHDPAWLLLC
jgi:hypothetical protein